MNVGKRKFHEILSTLTMPFSVQNFLVAFCFALEPCALVLFFAFLAFTYLSNHVKGVLVDFDQLLQMPQNPAGAKIIYSHRHVHFPVPFEVAEIILTQEYHGPPET